MPYIPFKSNSVSSSRRGTPSTALWKQMFHFYSFNQERFMQCYHKCSNVESTFSMIKSEVRIFGHGFHGAAFGHPIGE
jgi:hypothetical protein